MRSTAGLPAPASTRRSSWSTVPTAVSSPSAPAPLRVQTGLPLDDPFSVVRIDAAEIEADQGRLIDEARTVPMFSPKRLLWVRNAGAQKGLAEQVKLLCAEPPGDAVVLIEAGDLKKGVAAAHRRSRRAARPWRCPATPTTSATSTP